MSSIVLVLADVSKCYRNYKSEWRRVLSWFGFNFHSVEDHYVLQNISLSIKQGETVGIVGQNGAGKSTLLKIIANTLKPSSGTINIDGRVAAILELGMGFHPDLTGRQNVYHAAGLMGFTKDQIDATIDQIQNFAEIGAYFDEPVRTYSSGMQMRVAFSVATAYRPNILIVDEALSVGDAYFQHKSFNRIREFQKEGTTLLLVSHDKSAIQAICDRAILLEKGNILQDGDPEMVMDFYNALIADKENNNVQQITLESGKIQTISGTGEVHIEDLGLYNAKDEKVECIFVGEPIKLKVSVKIHQNIPELVLGYLIKDRLGQSVYGTNTHHLNYIIHDAKKEERIDYIFSFDANIGVGSYSLTLAAHSQDNHLTANYAWIDQALIFTVINASKPTFNGLCWIEPKVQYVRNK